MPRRKRAIGATEPPDVQRQADEPVTPHAVASEGPSWVLDLAGRHALAVGVGLGSRLSEQTLQLCWAVLRLHRALREVLADVPGARERAEEALRRVESGERVGPDVGGRKED